MPDTEPKELQLDGIGASPGICIGKVYMVDKEGVDIVRPYFVPQDKVKEEVNRFKMAVIRARDIKGVTGRQQRRGGRQRTCFEVTHDCSDIWK